MFMAMIGIIVFLVVGFGDNIAEGINTAYASGSFAVSAGVAAALAIAANVVSIALSERAYKKKMR